MCPSNICDYSWTGKKTKKNYEKGWKERKKTKNNNTKLFTHFCCKLSFCRDYALFGGHFLFKFGGEEHKNILYDRATRQLFAYVWHGADVFGNVLISAIGSPLTHSRFLECKTIQLSETRMLVRDLVIFVHQKLAFLVFFKLSTAMECRDFLFSGRLFNQIHFQISHNAQTSYKIWCIDHTILTKG